MRRYIAHIKETRTPHERRTHAMQVAGVLTGMLFALWLGSLGVRMTSEADLAAVAPEDASLAAAAAAGAESKGPQLEISTTSVYSY